MPKLYIVNCNGVSTNHQVVFTDDTKAIAVAETLCKTQVDKLFHMGRDFSVKRTRGKLSVRDPNVYQVAILVNGSVECSFRVDLVELVM